MIGIVTPYKTNNYGTKLQAYAMQNLISKFDDCEIVNFNTSRDKRLSALFGKLSFNNLKSKYFGKISKYKRKNNNDYNAIINARNIALTNFNRNYDFSKNINTVRELRDYSKKYDFIICGSDQLWSPANVRNDWFTLNIFNSNVKKISFSSSFGIEKIPNNMKKKYKKFLDKFDYIAVREISGKKIVEELVDKEATITLDPTLMIDKEKWKELANKSALEVKKPYVFCYFLGTNPKHREFVNKLAKSNNLTIVTLPYIKECNPADINFGDLRLGDVSPEDFLYLILNADYICTDSFHGTVFSVLFNKKFFVFERYSKMNKESTNSRIYSILKILGLENRLVNDYSNCDNHSEINYKEVINNLNNEKQKSFDYLKKALEKK